MSAESTESLSTLVLRRHSTRLFLPDHCVPRSTLLEALHLAQHAPSNSNIQPWHVEFVEGERRSRLCAALLEESRLHPREMAALPPCFAPFRRALGSQVYGSMGIARDDFASRAAAVARNYDAFGAPTIGIVSVHRELGPVDHLSVGMWLQTLLLALTERHVDSCVEASLATYHEVVRRELHLPDERVVLVGIAIGYADPNFPANHICTPRNPLDLHVTFLDNLEDPPSEH